MQILLAVGQQIEQKVVQHFLPFGRVVKVHRQPGLGYGQSLGLGDVEQLVGLLSLHLFVLVPVQDQGRDIDALVEGVRVVLSRRRSDGHKSRQELLGVGIH